MSARNDPRYRRAVRHTARLGALMLVYFAATAMAARKEPPGVHVSETGFTIVESARIDGATRSDYARAAGLLAQQRYSSGLIDFQAVLETQRTLLSTQESVATTTAAVAADHVRLYKALGGGWKT